ncbi:DUF2341 domain-containing protein [Methanosarcina acetivorans]|uniref:Cell surface protein n=1 Tax=Methanosarcina acetivorans (strain ATCC 35395 / DSM 2834 / JCM 12185 / C2A) TaxID=188937 RepID=Q8TPZ1_METAC|nr:DUF2341 domain-containing protein [Methanosarcina acetivorans]AAM05168.1 cell surface protein [Methanosarcina acetivorans C2A]
MKRIFLILCITVLMCMTGLASADVTTVEPVANFTANATSGTTPLTVQFTDISTNATSWSWDFENDGTGDSTGQNPAHTYDEAGTYSVKLTVTNTAGSDSEVKTDYITVEGTGTGGIADTPWPKFQANLNNTGQSPYIGPQINNNIWTYVTGNSIRSSPAIGENRTVYIGSYDGKLYAFNPDGTLKWSYTTGNQITGSATIGADGTICIGSYDRRLYTINPDGTLKWSYTTGNQIFSSAAIGEDGTIYVGSRDNKLYALNPDGTLKWSYTTGNQIFSSAAIGEDGTIYIGSLDKKLHALNPDGTLKWSYTTGNQIYGSPAIGSDGTIYIGSLDSKLHALNPDGTLKWSYTAGNQIYGSPAIGSDGTIYIGSLDSKLYALNPDGTLKWSCTVGNQILGSAALGSDGTIYIGSYDSKIYAITPDGTLKWSYATGNRIYGSPAIGSDGTLYIGSFDSSLYAFRDAVPVAGFTVNLRNGEVPLAVQFTDFSTGNITERSWDFGDNTTSSDRNPIHTYVAAGTYTVNLTVSNIYGSNSSLKADYITVGSGIPVGNFTANVTKSIIPPLTVQFNDTSTINPTDWFWDFGDNITSTDRNPIHTYVAAGTYTVNLTVSNTYGSNSSLKADYITVGSGIPSGNFTANVTSSPAPPLTVQFNDTSTINPTDWFWNFGDNSTSTEQNPVHTYAADGSYTVNLTVSNSYGSNNCVKADYIMVGSGIPVGNFTVNVTGGSAPLTVRFNDTSTVNPASWAWDFGDNTASTEQNPVHTYASDGNYTVNLKVSNSYGSNKCVKTDYITVGSGIPVANFTAKVTSGYVPLIIQFTDTSTVNPTSWAWDFGDNTTSTEQNPVHTYASVGNYTVTLKVTNSYGSNTETKAGYIYAGSGFSRNISFTASDQSVYQQEIVIHRTNGTDYEENTGDLNVWHVYIGDQCREDYGDLRFVDSTGTQLACYLWPDYTAEQALFYVRLEGADQPGKIQILYGDTGVSTASDADATGYLIDEFSTLNPNWNTSGVASAVINESRLMTTGNTGTFHSLSSAAVKQSITPIPGAFSAEVNLTYDASEVNCRGELFLVAYTSTDYTAIGYYDYSSNYYGCFFYSISGTTGDTGKYGSRPGSGSMHLKIIRDASNTISVYEDGTLMGTGTMAGSITAIGLTNTGYSSSRPGDTAYWDNLIVRSYSTTPPAESGLQPIVNFTANQTGGNAPLTVQFNDTSRYYPTSWFWEFGDGSNSTEQNPVHTYATEGNYTVNLTVANNFSSNTCVKTNYITVGSGIPIANLTANVTGGNAPLTVQFNETSTVNPASWFWDFGDNTSSTEQNPVHNYATEGNYTVNLTVANSYGSNACVKTDYIMVSSGIPDGNFTSNVTKNYAPFTVQFEDASTVNPTSWAWDFGDGTTSTEQKPVHTYTTPGNFTVNLTVSNSYGSNSSVKADYIHAGRYIYSQNITYTAGDQAAYQQELIIHRTNGSPYEENTADGIKVWHVQAGDQCREDYGDVRFTDATGSELAYYLLPNYTTEQGRFYVRLEEANQPGKLQVLYGDLEVLTTSDADATGYLIDEFSTLNPNWDTSGVASATIENGQLKTIPHGALISSGQYRTAGVIRSITPIPGEFSIEVDLTYYPYRYSDGDIFLAVYTSDSYTLIGYYQPTWGTDGGFGTFIDGQYKSFTGDGTRPDAGSMYLKITRDASNKISAWENGVLMATGTMAGNITSIGLVSTDLNNAAGGHTAYWDNLAIRSYSTAPPAASGLKPVGNFSVNTTGGNAPLTVQFNDSSFNSPASWAWDFGDGTTSTEQNPMHTYAADGSYTVNLTVSNSYGSSTLVKTDYITVGSSIPVANFTASVTGGNAPLTVQFTDTSTINPTSWAWDFGDGTTSTEQKPVHTYAADGNYTVNLTVSNSYGNNTCVKTDYIIVSSGVPVANFVSSVTGGNAPLTVQFTDTSTINPTSWAWDFGDGTTSTEQKPVHTYSSDGNYTVNLTVANSYGSNSSVKTDYITVGSGIPVANFTADVTNGYPRFAVQFTDTSTINPTSWAWDFGDGTTSTEQNPRHTYSTSGTYPVSLTVTNGYGSNTATKTGYIYAGRNEYYQKIDFSAGSQSVYQQVVVIHRSTGTAYEEDSNGMKVWHLYVGDRCREDYGDLRFTDSTGSQLAYYLQPDYTAAQARFYVRLEGVDQPGALNVLYGDAGLTTTSNTDVTENAGDESGYLFDAFSSLSTDWDISGVASATIDSDRLKTAPNTNTLGAYSTAAVKRAITPISGAFTVDVDLTYVPTSTSYPYRSRGELYLVLYNSPASYAGAGYYDNYYGSSEEYNGSFFYTITEANADTGQGTRPASGSMHLRISRDAANTVSVYEDGVLQATGTMPGDITAIGLTNTRYSTNSYYYTACWDNLVVRADTVSLPSASQFSGEVRTAAPPVASFTGTPVYGLPHAVQFTDTSANYPTAWSWDFGDGTTSTEQNPRHTYSADGNYTVTLTATNEYGSDTVTISDYKVETMIITSVTVSPSSVRLNETETRQFTAVLLDQKGNVMTNTSVSWSSSDKAVGSIDASGLFTARAAGKTNVTASAGGLNSSAEVTVIGLAPDLTVLSVSSTTSPVSNTVSATIRNVGTSDPGVFRTSFSVNGKVTGINVTGLAAGNTTDVSFTDLTRRKTGDIVSISATVDPENLVAELNETNNAYAAEVTVGTTGNYYYGGRYYSGIDLETGVYVEGNVALIYSQGSSGYQTGGGWYSTTVQYTSTDLPIPENAVVKEARLYQSYTWCNGDPGFTLQFNGNTVNQSAFYADPLKDGDGAEYGFNGQAVYNVTRYFNPEGNTAIIAASRPGGGLYGAVLAVVYEDPGEPHRMVWLDEGCDSLYGGSSDEYVGYAVFNNVTTSRVTSASATTVLPSGGDNGQWTILFNKQSVSLTGGAGSDPGYKYYDVTSSLQEGTNELGVRCDGYMNLAAAFLEVTLETASEANFTASTTSGNAPLVVQFTDTSTGTPTSWLWDFGDGSTSTEQNPVHTYSTANTSYTVALTVSTSLGADTETKTDYINVGALVLAPAADFSANVTGGEAPLSVRFTDASANTPTSWEWDFGDGSTSTEQNPVHTYEAKGTYNVTLTASNYGGNNTLIKTDYISVTSDVSAPVANFTIDADTGQVPFTVHFTDTSTGSVSNWKWDFGDGSTSTEQNPVHTYLTPGINTVTLAATGVGGISTTTGIVTATAPLTSDSYNGGIPLTTVRNGTVSGGLWYDSYPGFETSAQETFTLPDYTEIKWARLYVDVYCGHMQNNYRGNVTIDINADGDNTYELQEREIFNTSYSFPGDGGAGPVWLSDHMNRVTSDYLMWYDLTDVISSGEVSVRASSGKIDFSFDGRIKAMTLVIAYDDGDSDKVYYWVNQGHDTVNPGDDSTGYTGSTEFETALLAGGWDSANLSAVYYASVNGVYTFKGTALSSGTPEGSYFGADEWDINSMLTAGQNSTLTYDRDGSNYYKIPLALLSVRYENLSLPWQDNCDSLDDWTCSNCGLVSTTVYEGSYSIGCDASQQSASAERTIRIPSGAKTLRFDAATTSTMYAYNEYVKFYLDGNEIFSIPVTAAKNWHLYEFDLSGIEPGKHTFKVQADWNGYSWDNIGFYIDNIWVIADEEVLSVINVTPSEAELSVGENLTFAASAYTQYCESLPDTTFTWSSSSEAVGSINATTGFFTALTGGTTNVTASAEGMNGSVQITVKASSTAAPVANFSTNVTGGYVPLDVQFTDLSTGEGITGWLWDFGDGANSTEQNPVHTYESAGNYTVNLTVENAAGRDFELKTDYIEVSEASGSTVTLYFDPENSSVAENESTEISIVASNFPAGLSGYNLTVAIDDPAIAEIVDIEYPSWALITQNSTLPGTSIYMKTVDLEDAVKEGAADVVLATLTVSGKEKGSANLSIGVKRLEEDSGDSIEPALLAGTIEVTLLSPLPDQEYVPRDPDGDGLYEDLTGNGEFSFVDIVAYFHNMDWIEENMPVEYFDFNGNGRIDFDDVVDMFAMI